MSLAKRKTELPWMNVLFCAMVLWSHCCAHPLSTLDRGSWAFQLLYLLQRLSYVSVYGFFLLSGLKLTLPRKHDAPPLTYYAKRMRSVFLPYVLAVMIYYLWFVVCLHYFPFSWADFAGYVVRGDLSSHFYFVVGLFQFVLLAPALRWAVRRWSPALLLPFALGITWLSAFYLRPLLECFFPGLGFAYADRVFTTYLFYYLAGCCIGQNYEGFLAAVRSGGGLIWGLFLVFTAADLYFPWRSLVQGWSLSFSEPIHQLYLMSAILVCFWGTTRLPPALPGWLAKIDGASFLIYLYHCLAISVFDYLAQRMGMWRVGVLFFPRLAAVYVAVPLCCVVWQRLYAAVHTHLIPAKSVPKNL